MGNKNLELNLSSGGKEMKERQDSFNDNEKDKYFESPTSSLNPVEGHMKQKI